VKTSNKLHLRKAARQCRCLQIPVITVHSKTQKSTDSKRLDVRRTQFINFKRKPAGLSLFSACAAHKRNWGMSRTLVAPTSLKEITGYCEQLKEDEGSRSIGNLLSAYWCDITKDRHVLGFEIRGT